MRDERDKIAIINVGLLANLIFLIINILLIPNKKDIAITKII